MSVYRLAAIAQAFGGVFIREPFSGRVTISNAAKVPPVIMDALREHWGDLEAVLTEMSPPNAVDAAERILSQKIPAISNI